MAVIDWWNGPLSLGVIFFALCLLLLTWSIAGVACGACHSSGNLFFIVTHTHTHTRTHTHKHAHTTVRKKDHLHHQHWKRIPYHCNSRGFFRWRPRTTTTTTTPTSTTTGLDGVHWLTSLALSSTSFCTPSHRATWNCVQAFITNCCLPRQWSTSTEINFGVMGWLLLLPVASAASSGGRTHRRRGLNGKGLHYNIATSNIVSVALWGFDRQPRGSLFIPCRCGAPAHEKSFPCSCKVTGPHPIARNLKPQDNVPQEKRSPPHSLLSLTARFCLSRCLHYWHRRQERSQSHFLIHSAANNQQKRNIDIIGTLWGITGGVMDSCVAERERWRRWTQILLLLVTPQEIKMAERGGVLLKSKKNGVKLLLKDHSKVLEQKK